MNKFSIPPDGQQVWECLTATVRMSQCLLWYTISRVVRPSSGSSHAKLHWCAQEQRIKPVEVEHVPGVANVFADQLSRLHDPHKHLTVPDSFRLVPQAIPEIRSQLWYHALDVPCNDRLAAHGGRVWALPLEKPYHATKHSCL